MSDDDRTGVGAAVGKPPVEYDWLRDGLEKPIECNGAGIPLDGRCKLERLDEADRACGR